LAARAPEADRELLEQDRELLEPDIDIGEYANQAFSNGNTDPA